MPEPKSLYTVIRGKVHTFLVKWPRQHPYLYALGGVAFFVLFIIIVLACSGDDYWDPNYKKYV